MPAADEDLLIDAAIKQRKAHRWGFNMLLTLVVAAVFAAIGWVVLFRVRPFIKAIPLLPLGTLTTALLVIGVIAFVIAGLLVLGAVFAANPRSRWGDAAPGTCPLCGHRTLRQEVIEHTDPGTTTRTGPKGVVTLCETPGCPYATVKVTTPAPPG